MEKNDCGYWYTIGNDMESFWRNISSVSTRFMWLVRILLVFACIALLTVAAMTIVGCNSGGGDQTGSKPSLLGAQEGWTIVRAFVFSADPDGRSDPAQETVELNGGRMRLRWLADPGEDTDASVSRFFVRAAPIGKGSHDERVAVDLVGRGGTGSALLPIDSRGKCSITFYAKGHYRECEVVLEKRNED